MKYGLLGEKLTHSFSKEIHEALGYYRYSLCEVGRDELESFFKRRDFLGINVTIPYKKSVIEYLDSIDEAAAGIGAVNTVINDNGRLTGFNTDAFGLTALIQKAGVTLKGKKVLILGGGGTSATALYVAEKSGAGCVLRVSRSEKPGFITYEKAKKLHTDADVIINTTPAGMFPDIVNTPIDISAFGKLEAVIDAVYNPLNSRLVLEARERGITAVGGLYMLLMQAYMSARYFTREDIDIAKIEKIYSDILRKKRNIVLIGMPSAGKTSIGGMIAESLGMPFFDCDEQITAATGKTPADMIKREGEAAFRDIESKVIRELSVKNGAVIATGGGAVTVRDNLLNLKANGRVYYIDRAPELLQATADRPLSSSKQALEELYIKRRALYKNAADVIVENNSDINNAADKIRKDFLL